MPISVSTDQSRDLTIFTATGDLTFDDQMRVLREFYSGKPTKRALWDFRVISSDRITADELVRIREYITMHHDTRPGGKSAVVYDSSRDFGLSTVCDKLAENEEMQFKIRMFSNVDEAMKWLEQ